MPELKKGQDWTAGLAEASEAGGSRVERRGKGAEEKAQTPAMEGFSVKPTIASRKGDRTGIPLESCAQHLGQAVLPLCAGLALAL